MQKYVSRVIWKAWVIVEHLQRSSVKGRNTFGHKFSMRFNTFRSGDNRKKVIVDLILGTFWPIADILLHIGWTLIDIFTV